ncbi:hypothetical protein CERZMDRAFT_98221 [Cercospora zeae-maydis SCOH1-5]|uniref:Uncharacterized protein n=1 Tax=Cercospora zeae-maydis SCOH1-5 TaxID=717836 RepID=A0A6A6FE75_9PEZI|nr:hypothetical protein CERZMDRAFT_98221 [Cercospora zeae-maydis SCOH1-5]
MAIACLLALQSVPTTEAQPWLEGAFIIMVETGGFSAAIESGFGESASRTAIRPVQPVPGELLVVTKFKRQLSGDPLAAYPYWHRRAPPASCVRNRASSNQTVPKARGTTRACDTHRKVETVS